MINFYCEKLFYSTKKYVWNLKLFKRGWEESSNLFADLLFTGGCQVSSRSFRVLLLLALEFVVVLSYAIESLALKGQHHWLRVWRTVCKDFGAESVLETRNLLRLSNWKRFEGFEQAFLGLVQEGCLSLVIENVVILTFWDYVMTFQVTTMLSGL